MLFAARAWKWGPLLLFFGTAVFSRAARSRAARVWNWGPLLLFFGTAA